MLDRSKKSSKLTLFTILRLISMKAKPCPYSTYHTNVPLALETIAKYFLGLKQKKVSVDSITFNILQNDESLVNTSFGSGKKFCVE